MMTLGCARTGSPGARFTRLTNGRQLAEDARLDGILLSRLEFDVQIVGIPRVPEEEMSNLIRYQLRSIYPGNPEETAFDYRLESNGARRTAVVFVTRKDALADCRSAACQKPLLLPYTLINRIGRSRKNIRIWFLHQDWIEISMFRDGCLAASVVLHRGEETLDLAQARAVELDEARALPVLLVASSGEIEHLKEEANKMECLTGDAGEHVEFLSFEELEAALRNVDGLFRKRKRTPTFLAAPVRSAALAAVVAVLGILLLFKHVWAAERAAAELKRSCSLLDSRASRTILLQKEVDELDSELTRLSSAQPTDLYLFLSELSEVLEGDARIRSLRMQDDAFQIEAVGSNPLKLMERFCESPLFGSVKLSQAIPDPRLGTEWFFFSGVFHAR